MQTNFAKNTSKLTKQNGFTLIELIVVIVIVAILFTYTTLAIRGNSPEDTLKEEAQRLERLIELALEESILRGEDYGIEFFIDGYRFLHLTDKGWQAITNDKILRKRELAEGMELEAHFEDSPFITPLTADPFSGGKKKLDEVDDDEEINSSEKPTVHVYLFSSGEIVPDFDIRLYILGIKTSYFVKGNFDGELTSEISDL